MDSRREKKERDRRELNWNDDKHSVRPIIPMGSAWTRRDNEDGGNESELKLEVVIGRPNVGCYYLRGRSRTLCFSASTNAI